jgi:hypothetical protein
MNARESRPLYHKTELKGPLHITLQRAFLIMALETF